MTSTPNPVKAHSRTHELLNRLHTISLEQEDALTPEQQSTAGGFEAYMHDKFIALDQDKCHLIYHLCKSIRAKIVVEVGTSFGVSTIYLALAVSQNANGNKTNECKVIATENEPTKIIKARQHWDQAAEDDISKWIELREGDLNKTLASNWAAAPEIDFVLLDIWAALSLPALKLLRPHLRSGAIIVIDNTVKASEKYKDLLQYIDDDSSFSRLRLPYSGGLDLVRYEIGP
ncbi:unnamed protein product [Sympodiomycopsis kandeliae]